jgi:hypothetical protein
MVDTELSDKFKELQRLYAEHAKNQSEEDFKLKNKLRAELLDLFFALKPHIKKQTKLQWYEPAYNFAITGNLEYIESVKDDLSHIISHYEDTDPSETT